MKVRYFAGGYTTNIILGVFALTSMVAALAVSLPGMIAPQAELRITPQEANLRIGDTLVVTVDVESVVPVNAFTGEVIFNSNVFAVDKIEYNNSIADLWVTEPWYSKGENIIYFAGGTTKPGGFTGKGSLMTIYLRAEKVGFVDIDFDHVKILQHDGLGSETTVEIIDSLFTAAVLEQQTNYIKSSKDQQWISIEKTPPSTDLNGDEKVSLADISIFTLHFGSSNARYDFNQDGKVNFADLSIIMAAQ